MRHSQFARVLFFSASLSSTCVAGAPKTIDCLQVSVVPKSADPQLTLYPMQTRPGFRPLHMILTDVCSVDITAFTLEINVSSPVPQERHPGVDLLGSVAQPGDQKVPRVGVEFPFDWTIAGEADDPRPLELTVKVRGLVFRDGTAAGDASWVAHIQELRKDTIKQFATELKLLAQITHLEDAKAILNAEPDPLLKGAVRVFWLENKGHLSNEPAAWKAFIDRRTYELQSLIETMGQHPDLTMEDK